MEEKDLNADILFVNEKTEDVKPKVKNNSVPGNYIKVKLSSLGKLSAPPILHVRNYKFEEALELSEITAQNEKEITIKVLNEMIWEDFDANLLHEQEALEILFNVFARWWGTKIEGYQYYVNEDLPSDKLDKPENISIAEIPISNINTIALKEEVKEPINITDPSGNKISLILPRMQTSTVAKEFVNYKFIAEENKFASIKSKIEKKKDDYTNEEYLEYLDYTREKGKEYFRIYQAQLIAGFNDKEMESLDEALEVMDEFDLTVWAKYNSIVDEYFDFGIDSNVTFDCTVNENPITRRFLFRPMVFLPSVESQNDTGYTFSFG